MSVKNALQSMTGFGSTDAALEPFGTLSVELRSINHKALEIMIHLPSGFLSLEPRIKKEIEARLRRGRVTCAISICDGQSNRVSINKSLLKEYIESLRSIKKEFKIQGEPSVDALLHLPGVLSLSENKVYIQKIWPPLKSALKKALDDLVKSRSKEGSALYAFLQSRAGQIFEELQKIKRRFKKSISTQLAKIKIDDERVSFLKDTDITEEIERLVFHARNFKTKLCVMGPVGKELDFIAQEMQREANTMSAKSFDMDISAKVIQIKSQVEKIREQLQNVE